MAILEFLGRTHEITKTWSCVKNYENFHIFSNLHQGSTVQISCNWNKIFYIKTLNFIKLKIPLMEISEKTRESFRVGRERICELMEKESAFVKNPKGIETLEKQKKKGKGRVRWILLTQALRCYNPRGDRREPMGDASSLEEGGGPRPLGRPPNDVDIMS